MRLIQFEVPYTVGKALREETDLPDNWQVVHQMHTINFLVVIELKGKSTAV